MKLEQIDTSTDEGKLEVMRKVILDGRKVAHLTLTEPTDGFVPVSKPSWNWAEVDYAIIAEPVGPDEVWGLVLRNGHGRVHCHTDKDLVESWASGEGGTVVRYRRAGQ